MRQDTNTVAPPSPAAPAPAPLPRVEVDPSYMEEDFFAQFIDDHHFSPEDVFSMGLEETPEETPLDTPDDHFGSAALDAEITTMPCFGADYKTDSNPIDESFGIALDQLFAAAVQATAPNAATATNTPALSSLPPLETAPYVIDQTPALGLAPLPLIDTPSTPSTMTYNFPSSSSSNSRPTKPLPTGVRRNITVEKLVPLDAPTQSRHYIGESATSRKAVPAAFRKKRAISEVEDPNDLEAIEDKRRKNTLAARKSRARKLETLTTLQQQRDGLVMEKEYWVQRANVAEEMLRQHGLKSPADTT